MTGIAAFAHRLDAHSSFHDPGRRFGNTEKINPCPIYTKLYNYAFKNCSLIMTNVRREIKYMYFIAYYLIFNNVLSPRLLSKQYGLHSVPA